MYLLNQKTLSKTLNDKLNTVLNLLDESKEEFEIMERSVQDEDIREVISQLIEENDVYAAQLSSNISPVERTTIASFKKEKPEGKNGRGRVKQFLTKDDLLKECSRNESIFEKAYRDVLNSCTSQTALRNMIKDQLNEIKWKLMKIRLKYMINNNIVYPHSLQNRESKI